MLLSEIRNLKKNNYTQNVREHIIATNDTLKDIISQEIRKYGTNADLNHIDVSNVTDMSYMFENSEFNGDISNWNVSNVTNMSFMFNNSKFNGDISNWDVSNVTNMSFMFGNSEFNGDISKWLPMLQKNGIVLTELYYNFTDNELSDIEI